MTTYPRQINIEPVTTKPSGIEIKPVSPKKQE